MSGHNVSTGNGIAVVGISGRFPGADDVNAFWTNLISGIESVSFFDGEAAREASERSTNFCQRKLVRAGAVLVDAEMFDAGFFGYSPKEAQTIDPQQRIFLECAWHALETAGYDPSRFGGSVGVFAASGMSTYLSLLLADGPLVSDVGNLQILIGNDKDYLSSRVSYKLDLRGPSISVQTACSSSLVAIVLASQSLLGRHCDMALAGGVSIRFPQQSGYYYEPEGIMSPDGHCRPFDHKAVGTVFGDGAGVVVLKRARDALRDGDTIFALIKGFAVNNDGHRKIGFTAPSCTGQAEVIRTALRSARVPASSIGFVETHGTGTLLGDPIEIAALKEAYEGASREARTCAIGSVKGNVGHLDSAAGVTSFLKTVLALRYKQIPPTINFESLNPEIELEQTCFYVNVTLADWTERTTPRRAAVSSFGIGGTNAHVVLEEPPAVEKSVSRRHYHLIVISAKTAAALEKATSNLIQHLQANPEIALADVAYTQQVGRAPFGFRRVAIARDILDAVDALRNRAQTMIIERQDGNSKEPIVFMFPGQGSQHLSMAKGVYASEPIFRSSFDRCAELLRPLIKRDLRELVRRSRREPLTEKQLAETAIAQPALFVYEYSLAMLLRTWGLAPDALIGHSIGEYVAACVAGVFSLEDALAIVAERGKMMQSLPRGSMASVTLPEDQLRPLLTDEISIAAVNESSSCVISGPTNAIDRWQTEIASIGAFSVHRLKTSHAFHSAMMESTIEPFQKYLQGFSLRAPKIPFISNVSGHWIQKSLARSCKYWAEHLRQPVRFKDGLSTLLNHYKAAIFLEIGPGQSLSSFVCRHTARLATHSTYSVSPHPLGEMNDDSHMYDVLGRLWLAGRTINWIALYGHDRPRRIPLPNYPFERKQFSPAVRHVASSRPQPSVPASKRNRLSDWFYVSEWRRIESNASGLGPQTDDNESLIFIGSHSRLLGHAEHLRAVYPNATIVAQGADFKDCGSGCYQLDFCSKNDFNSLIKELSNHDRIPKRIIYALFGGNKDGIVGLRAEDGSADFFSIVSLVQALEYNNIASPIQLCVLTDCLCALKANDVVRPEQRMIKALCKVIQQEFPTICCTVIDIGPDTETFADAVIGISQIMAESKSGFPGPVVSYRRDGRFVEIVRRVRLDGSIERPRILRRHGIYLITGGLGKIGLTIAEELAKLCEARIALITRSTFPKRMEWASWISKHDPRDQTSERIRRIRKIEASGGKVAVCIADISDPIATKVAIETVRRCFGSPHGIIHAAGVVAREAFISISKTDRATFYRHFRPKVQGLLNLVQLLTDVRLDFWLLASSLSVQLGGLGFAAYSACNAFMDALAESKNRIDRARWIAINWDAWDFASPANGSSRGISPAEGLATLRRILRTELNQVIVSPTDLQFRLDRWTRTHLLTSSHGQGAAQAEMQERSQMPDSFPGCTNETEKVIAHIWQQVLGTDRIGLNDNFFTDLGAESLLATQAVSRLRSSLGVGLNVIDLFEHPTASELATHITATKSSQNISQKIVRVERTTRTVNVNRTT